MSTATLFEIDRVCGGYGSGLVVRDVSLSVDIRGRNQAYAVSKTLNLVNEMFVALHEKHPDYLVEHFGISQE